MKSDDEFALGKFIYFFHLIYMGVMGKGMSGGVISQNVEFTLPSVRKGVDAKKEFKISV